MIPEEQCPRCRHFRCLYHEYLFVLQLTLDTPPDCWDAHWEMLARGDIRSVLRLYRERFPS